MTHAGRLSPVICPLAKLGRSSSGSLEFTPSVRNVPFHHPYTVLEAETSFTYSPTLRCSSPCLDQGYHTLVTGGSVGDCANLPLHSTATKHRRSQSRTVIGSNFDRLRDELVLKIFSYLNSADLCACAAVCHRWENLAWEPVLWRTIALCGENTCGDKAVRCVLRRLCGRTRTGACPEVQRLFLSDGTKISDKGLTALARRCPELTHVQLHGSPNITNAAISELVARCPNLQHLDVTGCVKVSTVGVYSRPEPSLRLCLQYLDLTDCQLVDDANLCVIVSNCPQLAYLYLRRCTKVTDAGIKFVPSFCSALKELSVSDCHQVTDFGLYELAKLGALLRYLSVAKCDQVSDAGLKVVARRCYKLRYLNVRGCEAVSDDAITVLARSCARLRALDIGKCDVSDAGLRALAESCPNLKKLSLRNCDLVTDRGIQLIAYYCRGLQQLNIQDCQISADGYKAVKKYCKRCIIEHTNPGFF
ncbi:PREDICTED: F-box/LRR-repeat protein 7-like [Diuraphis noxia]|uniref:F-box/LRR-repeat protein 7-like n=1 Tax=Diuraphis noxia TaxID=143948 RepID=UPI0007639651|nr:PREDICTED: F-box/LRR-repeat protein 7-like [Diuraphis noxia]